MAVRPPGLVAMPVSMFSYRPFPICLLAITMLSRSQLPAQTIAIDLNHPRQTIDGVGFCHEGDRQNGDTYIIDNKIQEMLDNNMSLFRDMFPNRTFTPSKNSFNYTDSRVTNCWKRLKIMQDRHIVTILGIWDVPNWLVSNPSSDNGRRINNMDDFANMIYQFVKYGHDHYGLDIDYVDINETAESGVNLCLTSAEYSSFIQKCSALFASAGLSTKVNMGSVLLWDLSYDQAIYNSTRTLPGAGHPSWHSYRGGNLTGSARESISYWQGWGNWATTIDRNVWATETDYDAFYYNNPDRYNWTGCEEMAEMYYRNYYEARCSTSAGWYWHLTGDVWMSMAVHQAYMRNFEIGGQILTNDNTDQSIRIVPYQHVANNKFVIQALNEYSSDKTVTFTGVPSEVVLSMVRTSQAGEKLADVGTVTASGTSVTVTLKADSLTTFSGALGFTSRPDAPVARSATNTTSTGFTASWNSVPYATAYLLDVATDSSFGSSSLLVGYSSRNVGPSTRFTVTGLAPVTTYYYRVRASNSVGASDYSNAIAVSTPPIPLQISSPNATTFTTGIDCTFMVTAIGTPLPTLSTSGLPNWVSFDASTGELRGTAPANAAGTAVQFTLTADNGQAAPITQSFTLNVAAIPDASAVGGTPLALTTLAGSAGVSGSTDATGANARFSTPTGLAVDTRDRVYVADTGNDTIRQVTAAGVVTTLAGAAGSTGLVDGAGPAARFHAPSGLATDASDNLYVADTLNGAIRRVTSAGVVDTAIPTAAQLAGPQGVAHAMNTLYVADTNRHAIRQFTGGGATFSPTGTIGSPDQPGSADGSDAAAHFNYPSDLAVDTSGNLYVADTENSTIRKIAPDGTVTTLAGLAGSIGAADGSGPTARFNHPTALMVDAVQNLIVLDTDNDTIRRIDAATGAVTTVAGFAGSAGSADGTGSTARFDHPTGIAQASTGEFYIADTNNHTLRKGIFTGAPAITTQPQDTSVATGDTATFSVTATGDPSLTYRWFFNGTAISGSNNSTLSIANAQSASAGSYRVVVSNSLGAVTSADATLTVTATTGGGGGGNTGGGGGSGGSSGGGGGGAPSPWFLALLALGGGLRGIVTAKSSRKTPVQ